LKHRRIQSKKYYCAYFQIKLKAGILEPLSHQNIDNIIQIVNDIANFWNKFTVFRVLKNVVCSNSVVSKRH